MTKEEKKEYGKKEIVIPGEEIEAASDSLPGDWTMKSNDKIIATRLGVVERVDNLVKVIPISGVYIPRRGNTVIGEVKDLTMNGWIIDIKAPYQSFLTLKECPMFINDYEMEGVFGVGDLIFAKIFSVKRKAIDLTIRSREFGKIKEGLIVEVNSHRVPRVIGKEGSMVKIIKTETGCDITVSQNGLIWIKGKSVEEELFAKRAVEFVIENTTTSGLTEQVEKWLRENKPAELKSKSKETKEETE